MRDHWDLGEILHVSTTRAAGGTIRRGNGATEAAVLLELTGAPNEDLDAPVTHRFLLPLDTFTAVMALLEHAGKTALLLS